MTDAPPVDDVDLAPRSLGRRSGARRWLTLAVLVGLAALMVGLIWFLFTNSAGFYETDEAVERREDLGDRRIQLLGAPITTGTELALDGEPGQAFSVVFDGVTADIVFLGTTADLFQPNVPVVLEWAWVRTAEAAPPVADFPCGANDGWWFRADNMLVKHDNEYRQDRIAVASGRAGGECATVAEALPET